MGSAGLRRRPITNVRTWPILPVNEGLNGAESDFRFVLESGRSECTCWDRALRLLVAESGHSTSVEQRGFWAMRRDSSLLATLISPFSL